MLNYNKIFFVCCLFLYHPSEISSANGTNKEFPIHINVISEIVFPWYIFKTEKPDTIFINKLNKLSIDFINNGKYDSALSYAENVILLCNKPERFLKIYHPAIKNGIAAAYNNIGNIYYEKGAAATCPIENKETFFSEALKYHLIALNINTELKNQKDIAGSYLNIGIIYYYQNNFPEALKNYYAALNIREVIGDTKGLANIYINIGLVYDEPANFSEALKNYFSALKKYKEINDKDGVAVAFNNIGRIYNSRGHYSEAEKMYLASLKINEEIGNKAGAAFSLNNIGNIYWNKVNYSDVQPSILSLKLHRSNEKNNLLNIALKNYLAALKICEEIGDKTGIIESYINIGVVQMDIKKLNSARNYLTKALQLSKKIENKDWLKETYARLEELDSTQATSASISQQKQGEYWKLAYQHHKLFELYRDSIDAETNEIKYIQANANNTFKKKEAVTIENKKLEKQVFILLSFLLLLIFIIAGFIIHMIKSQKK